MAAVPLFALHVMWLDIIARVCECCFLSQRSFVGRRCGERDENAFVSGIVNTLQFEYLITHRPIYAEDGSVHINQSSEAGLPNAKWRISPFVQPKIPRDPRIATA